MSLHYLLKNDRLSTFIAWVLVLSCISYPITAVIIAYFGLPSNNINIGLKFVYLVYYIFVLILIIIKLENRIPKSAIFLLIFFLIYSVRIIIDNSIRDIHFIGGDSFYVYSYFFGATFIPSAIFLIGKKFIEVKTLYYYIFIGLALANILLFWYMTTLNKGELTNLFHDRAQIVTKGNEVKSGILINPILIAYYGGGVSLISIGGLLFGHFKNIVVQLFSFGFFILGFLNLILGASRGPFFSFLLLLTIMFIYYLYSTKKNIKYSLKIIFTPLIIASIVYLYILPKIDFRQIHMVKRLNTFTSMRNKGIKEYRDFSYQASFNDFLDSPVFGKQFVGTFDKSYPHNVFLETLMSTGLIGGIFLFISFIFAVKSLVSIWNHRMGNKYISVVMLCLLSFLVAMTSGSIFANPEMWILTSLLISMSNIKYLKNTSL